MSKADIVSAQKAALIAAEDAALQFGLEATYDGGFGEGVASVPVGTGGGFTQADIDAAVSAAVGPIKDQLVALQAKDDADVAAGQAALVDLQGKLDALSAKESVESGIITGLQSSKDALEKVLAALSGLMPVPVPPPVV